MKGFNPLLAPNHLIDSLLPHDLDCDNGHHDPKWTFDNGPTDLEANEETPTMVQRYAGLGQG